MDKARTLAKNALLAFVLVSVGFALGKHSAGTGVASAAPASATERVRVYYLHTTFRCVTCNTIEKMTKALLDKKFSAAMQRGEMTFVEANFQKDKALAKRFDVSSSCVVVAKMRDGATLDFKRLDEVWTLMSKPPEFDAYVGGAVEAFLGKEPAR